MKRTYTVNIGGQVFHIDEDAFQKLNDYLESIKSRFNSPDEIREIIEDVEVRIAEIFREHMAQAREVVTLEDVDFMIGIMGTPEDYGDGDSATQEEQPRSKSTSKGKKLYRNPDNRILGGVCGGMAEYFGIDALIVRIIFLISISFGGVFIYILLWAIIPEAITTAQKLEMKGEPINLKNIEKTIKDEFEQVKDNFKDMKNKHGHRDSHFHKLISVLISIVHITIRVALVALGIAFALAGMVIIAAFVAVYFTNSITIDSVTLSMDQVYRIFELFIQGSNIKILLAGLALFIGVPVLSLIVGGFRLIANKRPKRRILGTVGLMAWLIGLTLLIVASISEVANQKNGGREISNSTFQVSKDSILYFELSDQRTILDTEVDFILDLDEILLAGGNNPALYRIPELNFEISSSEEVEVIYDASSRGSSRKDASEKAKASVYNITQKDSLFTIDPYFSIGNEKFRNQEMEVTIRIPAGKIIRFNENMEFFEHDLYGSFDRSPLESEFTATKEGFR